MVKKIVCLMGPTACGKTDLSLRLALDFPFEIISVDSAMVYQGMDIGTAKPTMAERNVAPHHLIDIMSPTKPYSAACFRTDAIDCIEAIFSRGRIPLLVGGTMLYFKALQHGLSSLPSANTHVRNQLSQQAEKIGWQKMHERLATIDPLAAAKINPKDPQRIQRALEVYELTGKPLSFHWQQEKKPAAEYEFINLALIPDDRANLHKKIALRFDSMLEFGFIDEVKELMQLPGMYLSLPSMRSVGYRQLWLYLEGNLEYQALPAAVVTATRQLAKRQLTWLRQWPNLRILASENPNTYQAATSVLKSI